MPRRTPFPSASGLDVFHAVARLSSKTLDLPDGGSASVAVGRLRGWLWPFWLSRGCSLRNGQQRATAHRPGDAVFCLVGGDLQVVMALQIQPPAGAGREVTRKPQGRVRRDGSLDLQSH